jgi:hypothetical protein
MVAIGPRVGGAHVDVNLKFDDKSLKTIGKQIHKQLTEVSERNKATYRAIGRDAVTAWRGALGAILSGAPLIGSAMSAAAGGIVVLGGALYSLGQSAFAAAPLMTALGVAAGTAFIGLKSFFAALKSGDLSELTPSARAAAQAVQGLAGAWRRVRDEIQERMFAGLADDIAKLGSTLLPVLQKGLGKMADSLNFLAQEMLDYVNSASGLKTISKFLDNMAEIFKRLSKAVVPFLDGFLRLMNALSPAGKRLADRIADVAKNFQGWTKGEGFGKRIDDMMKRAEKTAGLLIDVLVNVYKSIINIFNAANPSTNRLLEMLVNVTQKFLDFTGSVEGQDSIAKWASQSVDVLAQFGKTAEAVFKVIAELADPRVITSFLATVEGAFNLLGQLPLDKMVTAFVTVTEAIQPVSSAFLAIIIAGAAINIMIGSLIGQFAGLFGILAGVVKFKILANILRNTSGGAKAVGTAAGAAGKKVGIFSRAWGLLKTVMDKIRGVLSKVFPSLKKTGDVTGDVGKKAGKLSGAFKPALKILGRFAKFAGPVGLAVWIGSLIADSDKLKGKLGNLWDAVKEVGTALSDAFSEIATALEPLGPVVKTVGKALGPIFGFLDQIATLAIGLVIDTITYAFKSLAKVIEGVGKIVAGFIDVIIGIATLDGDKILGGLKKMVSGIGPLLQGAFGLIVTFFAPARLLKLGATAFKALGGGIKSALPGILGAVGRMVVRVIGFVGRLPGRLLALGGQAIMKLAGAVKNNAPKVISAAGRIFSGVVGWIARLPGRLLALGAQAVTRLAGAVMRGVGRLRTIAGNIFTAAATQIAKLPGRLLTLGQQAITKLAGAVQAGVARLRTIAGNIKDAVVNALTNLPGQMLSIGGRIIGGLIDGVLGKLGALKDAASKVASAIKDALPGSPVKEGPLTAWNRGGGASGGGRNVIDAILAGLQDTDPIKKAMAGVAGAIGGAALTPAIAGPGMRGGAGGGQTTRNLNITINNPYRETASDSLTRTTRNLAYLGLT